VEEVERFKYIHKRGENHYEIQIPNGYKSNGNRDRITKTFRGSEEEAVVFRDFLLEEQKKEKESGCISSANSSYTLIETSRIYLSDESYKKHGSNTKRFYRNKLNNYILPELGKKKLRNISDDDITKLYRKMRDLGLTETSVKHVHNILNAIFNYAIHRKWMTYNPIKSLDNKPKFDGKEREYYDHNEIENTLYKLNKLPEKINGLSDTLTYFKNFRFKTAITLLFNSGMRREELFGLKWKDIKFRTNVIEIRRAVICVSEDDYSESEIIEIISKSLVCKLPKNDASKRNITVPDVCMDLLQEYRLIQKRYGYPASDDDYVFQQIRKRALWSPNDLTMEWAKFIDYFHLRKITVHDIRHSHATDLLNSGVPIAAVSKRLGHSDIATTLKIYAHSNLQEDRQISELLDKKYNNHYVKDVLSFNVLISIITGKAFAPVEDINKALKYLSGNYNYADNSETLMKLCKNYILDKYSYLEDINKFITNEINSEKNLALINLLCNASNDLGHIRPMNTF